MKRTVIKKPFHHSFQRKSLIEASSCKISSKNLKQYFFLVFDKKLKSDTGKIKSSIHHGKDLY